MKPKILKDAFDPVLSLDTPLFLDPFLIYGSERGHFKGSHEEVITFFNSIFRLVARSRGKTDSVFYRKAVTDLVFPEVAELCLGYTQDGTSGSGSGRELARLTAAALWDAINHGLTHITHFEEIGILREGIGADRISDITGGLLRHRLATYTTEICAAGHIPVKTVRYVRGRYDAASRRWVALTARLPVNRYNDKPVLLVPRRYLRDLPTLNASDFWDYCWANENETIRTEFSHDITSNVSKKEIVELARNHPELRKRYLKRAEKEDPEPYDFARDPLGVIQWYEATEQYARTHTLALVIKKAKDFESATARMMGAYQHYVEEQKGWTLLWNDDGTAKGEKAAQHLFLGIVKHYCAAANIDVSPESNIGRGPVDFKVSQGYRLKALIEVKLAKNTKFWSGLTRQLPAYLKAEKIKRGHFLVIVQSDADLERVKGINRAVKAMNASTEYEISATVVDARKEKPSASKL